jgi:class 3 adenylate cyclase/tetratricopeptide (TPR) repeat protein
MQCPKCQFENPEGMKFCVECGNKLEAICRKCGFSNSPSFKFCGECGRNLTISSEPLPKELSFDEKLGKIQKYLPKGLTEKILAQRDRIEGERKHVSVMFCDMEGFTKLAEKIGPEEAYIIMDKVYEILIHKVHDYEGTVNELTGDGIMALFGAPIALEDAPQRAIRSSLAIHREMTKFSEKLSNEKGYIPSLRMRIGIHTGLVVVGTLGNDLRVEFKAVGDTVNLASRIEALAEPGSSYVSEETFKLTEGLFRFEALGEKIVKGKEAPVKTYRVIAPSSRRTRFDVSAERGLTPFVGRDRDLELLLDGFERSKTGFGQAISILAEAGVGKSRLLYEFRKAISNENVTFLEGKCLSYSRSIAYHPIIDILKSNFEINENDDDFGIKGKVRKGIEVMGVDEATTLPYILELLPVKESGIEKIPMSPEAKKDRIMQALKRIVLRGSELQPLILVFEDLHWADKSSVESLKDISDSISGAKVLLIFTYRHEFIQIWGGKTYHSQITLNRLSNRESLSMAMHLLDTEDLDYELENLLLEKTEGIPFFIEEFIKSLNDLKMLKKKDGKYRLAKSTEEISIPSTIQAVIMARVDALPEGAKEMLQVGAAIEREFSHLLLKKVIDLSDNELLAALACLKDSELLFERGIYPESMYVFKHALTRDVVYGSILAERKKRLHLEIGNAIEELNAKNIDEYYEILAEHYITSENYVKAAEYYKLAAKKAGKAASFAEALSSGEKLLTCLERLPQTDDIEIKMIDARTTIAFYIVQQQYYGKVKIIIDPVFQLALKHEYKKGLTQIYTLMGIHSCFPAEDLPKAIEYFEKAIKMAEETNNFISLLFAHHFMGHVLADNCEFERGLFHIKKALEIVEMGNVFWSIAMHKACIAYFIYCAQGRIDLAYQSINEALSLAEESGDISSKAEAYTNYGACCIYKGLLDDAEKHLLIGKDLCERANFLGHGHLANYHLGNVYKFKGRYGKAVEYYNNALSFEKFDYIGPSRFNHTRLALTAAKVLMNEKNIDFKLLYAYVSQNKIKQWEGYYRRSLAEILLNFDDDRLFEAEDWIQQAIQADTKNDVRFELGLDYATHSEIYKRKEDRSNAKEKLGRAIDIFKKCGADGWAKKYEKELAELQ